MRISIFAKIAFTFSFIVAVILIGVYFYFDTQLLDHTYTRIEHNLKSKLTLSKSFLESQDLSSLDYAVDTLADSIGADLDLRVTIIGSDGTVFGDSDLDGQVLYDVENHIKRPEVQKALKSGYGVSRRYSTTVKKDMLYMASVFLINNEKQIIRLSMPLDEIAMISTNLQQVLFFGISMAIIFSLVITLVAATFLSRPIKEIAIAAKHISDGDYSYKIDESANDELGDLAHMFNSMCEQIKLKINDVVTNKSRLEAVLLSMFDGIMVVDTAGRITLVNKALQKTLSVNDKVLQKQPIEVVRNIEIQELVDAVLRSEKLIAKREITILQPEEKYFIVHATQIMYGREMYGAVLVFHDITELRKLEKIRKDFVANVSHELRTPIATIKGYTETLLDGALDDYKNAREFLEIIEHDADRLAKVINDLLDLSSIESNRFKLDAGVCNITQVAERVITGLAVQARAKNISLHIESSHKEVAALADEELLTHVFVNLIDNAIKYTDQGKGAAITIRIEREEQIVRISIIDQGIGISEKDIPRIFERFYRVDKARSRDLGGTGLGLSIVKHIIQAHNGEIMVESAIGVGSTFSFTLPSA